jgi:gamma-glutamyl hydrolase
MKAAAILLSISVLFGICSFADHIPVIGILSVPGAFNSGDAREIAEMNAEKSIIASSYVKFVESAGARVVPIPYDSSEEKVSELLQYVNGVLFTGGTAPLALDSDYMRTAKQIFDYVKD